jgi:acetyltransferase-like isoleucine patch superfamily enzyme
MSNLFIHPLAVVEDGAKIGSGTSVWHYAHIRAGATVGKDCILGKGVYVDTGVTVGDRCKIQNGVNVYVGVTLEDDVFVGPSATFTNDLTPRAFNKEWEIVNTSVESGASIGANATVVCGVVVGSLSMIAAGAIVTRDVRPHELVAGAPAATLGWVCRCGTVISRDQEPPQALVCERCKEMEG